MSTIQGYPHKYQKPRIGQVFRREQQDGRWEYGQIAGMRVTEMKDADGKPKDGYWIAHLTTGWVDFRDVIRSDTSYSSTEDWHPVPEESKAGDTKASEAAQTARPSRAAAVVG
jgi:hypothetical protein